MSVWEASLVFIVSFTTQRVGLSDLEEGGKARARLWAHVPKHKAGSLYHLPSGNGGFEGINEMEKVFSVEQNHEKYSVCRK